LYNKSMFQIRNADIAKILREMGGYYQMENEPWRPRAYEKAADSIESLDGQVEQIYREDGLKGLLALAGVGQRIAGHIEELLKTGRLKVYETLKKKMPVDLTQLTSIEGIGAKTVKELYIKLKIKNLKDLKKAVSAHKLSKIKGFGKRTEDNIRKSLDSKTRGPQRYLLGYIYPLAQRLKGKLQASGLFQSIEIGGSLRRRQETVGDLDYLGVADNPKAAMEFFVNLPGVGRVLEHGLSKSEIKMEHGGIQVDLRLVPRQSWGAALIYFTGDLGHNIKLRKMAIEKGWKLSEYGITSPGLAPSRGGKKGEVLFGKSEEEVYKKLGLKQVPPPEIRTDSGEIEAAQQGKLPTLIDYSEVRGDLQIQTDWTDGTASIEEMAKAAIKLGREYIAITDHTKTLHVAHGLDEKRLIQQGKEIDRLNVKFAKSPPPLSSPLKPTPKASTLLGDPGKGEEFPSLEGRGSGRVMNGFEKWLLDLVAIGTIADCQSLLGENRILVKWGMYVMQKTRWIGLRKLMKMAEIDGQEIDSYKIGFIIAPRINAAGRMEHADAALKLLLTDDESEAETLALNLDQLNKHRQEQTERILSEAREQMILLGDQKILVAAGEGWHKGIVGLVAGKLTEEFYRPVLVMDKSGQEATGSARSVGSFNIIEAIGASHEILVKYGGHPQAAGFTLRTEHIEIFRKNLLDYAETSLSEDDLSRVLRYDALVTLSQVTDEFIEFISKFEPTGIANPRPKFRIDNLTVKKVSAIGKDSTHLRLFVEQNGAALGCIGFKQGFWAAKLRAEDKIDVICEPQFNEWNGQKNIQLKIVDLVSSPLQGEVG